MKDDELAAIRARADRAHQPPWGAPSYPWIEGHVASEGFVPYGCDEIDPDDAEFIAHAREDVPALLDRIAELEAALAICDECRAGRHHNCATGRNPFAPAWCKCEADPDERAEA